MRTCLYYWLIEPLRELFRDTPDREPALEIEVHLGDRDCTLAVVLADDEQPEYARLTIPGPGFDEGTIPRDFAPGMLTAVREHLLSVLRLTYTPYASLFSRPIWTFVDDLTEYSIGLSMHAHLSYPRLDTDRAKRVFVSTFDVREEIRLFIDGKDERIPLQYRFLSLYKILEIHFKKQGKWKKSELGVFLESYREALEDAGAKSHLDQYLHELRDKCAHIKTGTRRFRLGVTHLNQGEAHRVEKALAPLGEIAAEVLNVRGQGKYHIERRLWGPRATGGSLTSAST